VNVVGDSGDQFYQVKVYTERDDIRHNPHHVLYFCMCANKLSSISATS